MGNKRNMFYLKQRLVWVWWAKWTQPRLVSCSLLRVDNRAICHPGHSAFFSHPSASLMFLLVPPPPLPPPVISVCLDSENKLLQDRTNGSLGSQEPGPLCFLWGAGTGWFCREFMAKTRELLFPYKWNRKQSKSKSTLHWAFLGHTDNDSSLCQNLPWSHQTTLEI